MVLIHWCPSDMLHLSITATAGTSRTRAPLRAGLSWGPRRSPTLWGAHQQDVLPQDLNSLRMATGPTDTPRQGMVINKIQGPVRVGRQGSNTDPRSIPEAGQKQDRRQVWRQHGFGNHPVKNNPQSRTAADSSKYKF